MDYFDFHTHNKNAINAIINLFHNESPEQDFIYSIGVHPWHILPEKTLKELKLLNKTTKLSNIVAIGECGFDKNAKADFELQKSIFIKHVELSESLKKPITIHCVGYYEELIKLKKELKPSQVWVFHGYNKNAVILKKLINAGFFISIGPATIKNLPKTKVFLEVIPMDKLLLETDDYKVSIEEVYKAVGNIIDISPKELAIITDSNNPV